MNIDKYISYQIQKQFPSIYVEDGDELVEFVKSYYQFLEQDIEGYYVTGYVMSDVVGSERSHFATKFATYQEALAYQSSLQSSFSYNDLKIVNAKNQGIYHNRRLFEYNDIDDTLGQMLLFYKNKYLSDLPFEGESIRFITKHILDLYRRKGTQEGILLFFRLFYSENVTIYHPSQDIIKPSSSIWKEGQYVELYPRSPESLANLKGLPIYGSVSKATAVVDRVNFTLVNNTLIPVIYLSNVKGNFIGFDDITNNGTVYGVVRGSLQQVTISENDVRLGLSNNYIGDTVSISNSSGYGGLARVSKISTESSGAINFALNDGGFGYTANGTNVIISDQVLFMGNPNITFIPLETISQSNNTISGVVVGQRLVSSDTVMVGVKINGANTFVNGVDITTTERDVNITENVQFASPYNNSAAVEISDVLTNTQTISIITDLISDFLDVTLDSSDYSAPPALTPMSGGSPITLSTQLDDAFVPGVFEIGTISALTNINPGFEYVNDVFVLAKDDIISRFNLVNQVISFDPSTTEPLVSGVVVTQHNPLVVGTNRAIRGIIRERSGSLIEVMQLSFEGFTSANSMYIDGSNTAIDIVSVERNYSSMPLGLNAQIDGVVEAAVGKILAVDVYDSGLGFVDGAAVAMKNSSKIDEARSNLAIALSNPSSTPELIAQLQSTLNYWLSTSVSSGTASALGQGKTAGVWESKTSQLNSKKVVQDSDFYQDFSYEISSKLNPTTYLGPLKDIVHVSGTKVFHKFSLEERINTVLDVSMTVSRY